MFQTNQTRKERIWKDMLKTRGKKEEDKSVGMKEDRQDTDKNQGVEVTNFLQQPKKSVVLLDREDSATELT